MGVDDPHAIYRQIIAHPTLHTDSPLPGEQLAAHHWRAFSTGLK
jgi:hypothetical protein